eukprot:240777-Rhodomonas_salina.3
MSLGLPTQHPQAGNRLVDPLGSDIVGVVGVVRLQVSEVFSASESVEGGVSVASGSAPLSGVVCGAVCGDIGALCSVLPFRMASVLDLEAGVLFKSSEVPFANAWVTRGWWDLRRRSSIATSMKTVRQVRISAALSYSCAV